MAGYGAWIWGSRDETPPSTLYQVTALVITTLALCGLHALYYKVIKPGYLSELHRIPVPHWTAHFSSRWMTERRREGYESRTIYAAHQKHGPVVRLGPDEVSVMSLEGVRKIYGAGFERTRWFDEFMNYGTPNLVTLYGKENHARRRRMVSHLFSKSAIMASPDFQVLSSVILWDRLLPVLGTAAVSGEGIDFYRIAFALGAEFMSAYEFGIQNSYDLVSMGREDARNAYLEEGFRKLRGTEGPEMAAIAAKELEAQLMTMIETTREEMQGFHPEDEARRDSHFKSTKPVTFANLSDHIFEKEYKLSMQDALKLIASEMLDNIEAAREGIGLVLTYVSHELSLHDDIQSDLRNELREAFVSSPVVATQQLDADTIRGLDKLPLLDAVLTETLRIRPPAPGPMRRWVPDGGVVINNYFIPEKTTVHVAPYCLHRTHEVFPDAETWTPQRWLQTKELSTGSQGTSDPRNYIFTFSSGPRTCLGKNFATTVIKLVLALVYTNFETSIVDDAGIEQVDDVMGWPKGSKLILRFKKV